VNGDVLTLVVFAVTAAAMLAGLACWEAGRRFAVERARRSDRQFARAWRLEVEVEAARARHPTTDPEGFEDYFDGLERYR